MNVYYEHEGIKYKPGDKVRGVFADWDDSDHGVVRFGEFDAFWPTGAHEWADAYGFYVETEKHKEGYSITQIKNLSL